MPPRTSSRSSATRDKASSPLKSSANRQSRSPISRRTRATRSRSVELDGRDNGAGPKRGSRRGARQGSTESAGSNASAASGRGSRSRTATRAAVANLRDLSTVAEDREEEIDEQEISSAEDNKDDEDTEHEVVEKAGAQRSQSPGGLSQMSGTTAISSFTAVTSHSMEQVSNLDPIIVELLPGLLESSYSLMKLLAPSKILGDRSASENIVKELKTLGSRRCRLLKVEESVFDNRWSNFVSNETAYINLPLFLLALVGTSEPDDGDFRPDAVIHAANLAHLMRNFMVLQKGQENSSIALNSLDLTFPKNFVSGFSSLAQFGTSALRDEFFDVGLEIRTQTTIDWLLQAQHELDFDPDRGLANIFYTAPATRNPKLSEFDDLVENGSPKIILHGETLEMGTRYASQIKKRVEDIRSTFRTSELAIRDGDRVDFKELDDQYPWQDFQWKLACLANLRLKEISRAVKSQGGIENIKMSLVEALQSRNSQTDVRYSPPSSVIDPHAAEGEHSASPPSFYTIRNGKAMIRSLQRLRQSISSSNPQSAQPKATSIASKSAIAKLNKSLPSRATEDSVFMPNNGGDDNGHRVKAPGRDTVEYSNAWDELRRDKNKENLPVQKQKRSLLDRQPNAQRVEWGSQETEAGPATRKRSREEEMEEESSESVDEGFQEDKRVPDPTRRVTAPAARRFISVDRSPASKRARGEDYEDSEEFQDIETVKSQQRASRRQREASAIEDSEDEDDESDSIPGPTASQVRVVGNTRANLLKLKRAPQVPRRRIPWSEFDTKYLVDNIELFGCAWSTLQKLQQWETERDQVALKDKARNLKVNYLRAGIELPINFEDVPLGRKEIAAVKKVIPDYEP